MTTSQISFLSEIIGGGVIPPGKLAYFRQRLRNRLHSLVLTEFSHRAATEGLTKKDLAGRIGKEPAQITRWLTASGNWTLDTLSDLLLGMGAEPQVAITHFAETANAPIFKVAAFVADAPYECVAWSQKTYAYETGRRAWFNASSGSGAALTPFTGMVIVHQQPTSEPTDASYPN